MAQISKDKVIQDTRDAYIAVSGDTAAITYGNLSTKISSLSLNLGYAIDFEVNNEKYYISSCKTSGTITAPPQPTGESFSYWATTTGSSVSFPYTPTGSTTLTAVFGSPIAPIMRTTFNMNTGTPEYDSSEEYYRYYGNLDVPLAFSSGDEWAIYMESGGQSIEFISNVDEDSDTNTLSLHYPYIKTNIHNLLAYNTSVSPITSSSSDAACWEMWDMSSSTIPSQEVTIGKIWPLEINTVDLTLVTAVYGGVYEEPQLYLDLYEGNSYQCTLIDTNNNSYIATSSAIVLDNDIIGVEFSSVDFDNLPPTIDNVLGSISISDKVHLDITTLESAENGYHFMAQLEDVETQEELEEEFNTFKSNVSKIIIEKVTT